MNIQDITLRVASYVRGAIAVITNRPFGEIQFNRPPKVDLGDFSFGCFALAKDLKTSPNSLAKEIASLILSVKDPFIQKVEASGAYVNIKVNPTYIFGRILMEEWQSDFKWPVGPVMVEYLSPNTNKPLHLGHLRNGAVGMAVGNILSFNGYNVVKANLINDRGIHICKSMIAWLQWGEGETPELTGIKGDHFVGKWYVRFDQEYKQQVDAMIEGGAEKKVAEKTAPILLEAQAMLLKWESDDPEVLDLWRTMNSWVYDGFEKTYQRLGFKFGHFYYESNTYKLGKDIVEKGLNEGIFYLAEEAVEVEEGGEFDENRSDVGMTLVDLPATREVVGKDGKTKVENWFGTNKNGSTKKATVLRADGTSVYLTQDLGTAVQKFKDFGLSRSIYVVGSEQEPHFKVLFAILTMLGYKWADQCYHLSYGMVFLPEGKMKSREGKVVDADNLVDAVKEMASIEIRKRDKDSLLRDEEISIRAEKIALGAIKFYLLKFSPRQDIKFNPAESIAFEGQTGPYCMYTYARGASLLSKASEAGITTLDPAIEALGNEEEMSLAHKLMDLPTEMEMAMKDLNPCRVASYVYDLCKVFNQFYHQCPVLDADNKPLSAARLLLVKSSIKAIKQCLEILGIDALETM